MGLNVAQIRAYEEHTGHCLFGPSGLKRRMSCLASAKEELNAPIPATSEYAAEGTRLHESMEQCLEFYLPEADSKDPISIAVRNRACRLEPDFEKLGGLYECIDFHEELYRKHLNPSIGLELEGTLAHWDLPMIYGTADDVIKSQDRIDVIDWKFGRGVPVFAEDNLQGLCYLATQVDPKRVGDRELGVHIAQPFLDSFTSWKVDPRKLTHILDSQVAPAIQIIMADDKVPYNPTMENCRFCNAKMSCVSRRESLGTKHQVLVAAAKAPELVEKERWRKVLDAADDMQQAIKDVRAFATEEIKKGRGFPGYKMIAGRSTRYFRDDEGDEAKVNLFLHKALGSGKMYLPAKRVSPAQAEKMNTSLKKDARFKKLWKKAPGKAVLKKQSDKGAPLVYGSKAKFAATAVKLPDNTKTPTTKALEANF